VTRALGWTIATALVVLCARTLAYALAPLPTLTSLELQESVGGPRLVAVVLVSLGLALALSTAIVGLAALAVRERAVLERRRCAPPRLRLGRAALRFAFLFAVGCVAFAYLESYLHWRAGLGWHGLHCLVGPAHRDAVPLLAALSLVAVALVAAVEHLVAWARRTFAALRAAPRVRVVRPRSLAPRDLVPRSWRALLLPARGPPVQAVSVSTS
jgi:hypothetical protein